MVAFVFIRRLRSEEMTDALTDCLDQNQLPYSTSRPKKTKVLIRDLTVGGYYDLNGLSQRGCPPQETEPRSVLILNFCTVRSFYLTLYVVTPANVREEDRTVRDTVFILA